MVFVEDALGIHEVVLDLGLLAPRQRGEHVDVVTHHRRFGRHGRHELELLELSLCLLARLSWHLSELDLFLDLLDVRPLVALAQFLLDGLDLLVQVEVTLVLLHLAFDAATNLLVHVEDVHLAVELLEQVFEARLHIRQVQHHLLVFELEGQVRSDGVRQTAGIVNAGDGSQNLGRNLLVELDVLVKLLHHGAPQGLNFAGLVGVRRGLHRRHGGHEVRLRIFNRCHQRTLLTFHQHLHGAVGQLEHLQDGGDTPHIEHVRHRRLILGCGLLGHQHDAAVGLHGHLQSLDALGAAHEKRDHHVGEHHHVTQRQQRQVKGGSWQGGMSGHGNPQSALWKWVHMWGFSTLARSRAGTRVDGSKGGHRAPAPVISDRVKKSVRSMEAPADFCTPLLLRPFQAFLAASR